MNIKNKKFFKNKTQMIVYLTLFIIMGALFIYFGNKTYNGVEDNILFANEFKEVDKYTVFNYTTARDINLSFEKNIVVLFGFRENKWTGYMASILNDAAITAGVDKIYYYDFLDDRTNNSGNYQVLVEKLNGLLYTNDRGKKHLYAPTVLIIKNGKIIYYDDETAFIKGDIEPSSYWTNEKSEIKKIVLVDALREYRGK